MLRMSHFPLSISNCQIVNLNLKKVFKLFTLYFPRHRLLLIMNRQTATLSYEIANPSNVVGITLEELPCIIPQAYVMSLEQPNSPFQFIKVNKDKAQMLGLCNKQKTANFLTENLKEKKAYVPPRFGAHSNGGVNLKVVNNSIIFSSNDCPFPKKEIIEKPLGSCENPIEIIQSGATLHSRQNLSEEHLQQIAEALQQIDPTKEPEEDHSQSYIFEYEIVYPEELDIKPLLTNNSKRSRRKRKPVEEEIITLDEPVIKNVRTRSGRITRPPRYIEKDFKKIDTSEAGIETVVKITEFKPLKTNQEPTLNNEPVKTETLEMHKRKRQIASQFRCPKCKKAYLGRSRMVKHLQQNPSHGTIPDYCKPKQDNQTWNFLISLALKCPVGKRGLKFCKELISLLKNAKILAKVLFKQPLASENNLFYVDENLGAALGIECGKYCLNDNELIKDVSVLTLLDNFKIDVAQNESNNSNLEILRSNFDENSNSLESLISSSKKKDFGSDQNSSDTMIPENNKIMPFLSFKLPDKDIETSRELHTPSPPAFLKESFANFSNDEKNNDIFEKPNEKFRSLYDKCLINSDQTNSTLSPNKFLTDVKVEEKKSKPSQKKHLNVQKRSKEPKSPSFADQLLLEESLQKKEESSHELRLENNSSAFSLLCASDPPGGHNNSKFTDSVFNFCNFKVENESDNIDCELKPLDFRDVTACKSPELKNRSESNFTNNLHIDCKETAKEKCNEEKEAKVICSSVNFVNNISQIGLTDDGNFMKKTKGNNSDSFEMLSSCKTTKCEKFPQAASDFSLHINEKQESNNEEGNGGFEMLTSCKSTQCENFPPGSTDFSLLIHDKQENNDYHQRLTSPSDLLVENSLLTTLSRSADELMTLSSVDSQHMPSFLDNSASSDEIMNVDQFVNERFKNLTEADLDLGNPSINSYLQTIDLFPFNSS